MAHTGKPFGVYGITHGGRYTQPADKGVLDQARFAFFRDSVSLELARKQGVKAPIVEWGPDAAFAVDIRDDELAAAYLVRHGLEAGKFLAFIPKLRYRPYWKIDGHPEPRTEQERTFWKRTQETMEPDHAKLRAALVTFVRKTGMKLLLCPEDSSHMEVNKSLVFDKLPEDVRAKAVIRDTFWDIGLGDWLFDLDAEANGANMAQALLDMATDPATARGKVEKAMAFVRKRQQETMAWVAKELALRT